jgi:hypothetical protein
VQRREQPEELLRYDLLPPHLNPITSAQALAS